MKSPWSRSCLEATRLIAERMDRRLTLAERIGLRFHLAICHACPRVARQMEMLRDALKGWRKHVEED